jgi:2,4-dienoyl-CoA reductase-like NADH-dependent reductase (Old Yellow Enzyme family)
MIDGRHCGSPGDLVVELDAKERSLDAWKRFAKACQASGTPALVQLNHPGRQSPIVAGSTRGFWEKALAPSAVALNIGDGLFATCARAFLFGTPKEMSIEDIEDVVRRFTDAAKFMSEAGFGGVELHGAQYVSRIDT